MNDDDALIDDEDDVIDFEDDLNEQELGAYAGDDYGDYVDGDEDGDYVDGDDDGDYVDGDVDGDNVDDMPPHEAIYSDDEESLANMIKDVLS